MDNAIEAALLDGDASVVTDYEFFLIGRRLHRETRQIGLDTGHDAGWNVDAARKAMRRLFDRRVIVADADFRSGLWRVVQSSRSGSAQEIACIADPFCYVSHLSAMELYGLTDRSPEALHLTTPWPPLWNALRDAAMAADLAGTLPERPVLAPAAFKSVVRRRPVSIHRTRHPASPVSIAGERTRIASIGRTFADMLDMPALCGGMQHILDVWERWASDWTQDIIAAVDAMNVPIVKVRAGYVLSERLGIDDARVDRWQAFAQRGGSRKLDPDASYAPTFSERWMLSLNA